MPETSTPTGPTEHLDTVEYWRDLYSDAIAVGQSYVNVLHVREKELLDLKGPCSNSACRLHHAHSGPCLTGRFGAPPADGGEGEGTEGDGK